MSGGNYEYVSTKDVEQLFNSGTFQIERIAERLAELPYGAEVSKETYSFLFDLRATLSRLEARLERIQPIWRALEWWDSGDTRESTVRDEVRKYLGCNCNAPSLGLGAWLVCEHGTKWEHPKSIGIKVARTPGEKR